MLKFEISYCNFIPSLCCLVLWPDPRDCLLKTIFAVLIKCDQFAELQWWNEIWFWGTPDLRPIFLHRDFQTRPIDFIFVPNERYVLCGAQKNTKPMPEYPEKSLLERLIWKSTKFPDLVCNSFLQESYVGAEQ